MPGDGHCIIHSVLAALKQRRTSVPTTSEVLNKLKSTLQGDLDLLAPFINSNKTDPLEEIDAYIQLANFNSNIVDLIIPLISKILDVGICVLQLDTAGVLYVTNDLLTFPSSSVDDPLYVLKSGSHYDALLLKNHISSDDCLTENELDNEHNSGDTATDHPDTTNDGDLGQSNNDDDVFFDCKELSALLDTPQNDSGNVPKDINLIDPSIDPKIILASLCAKAPDFEVRDLLRAYSPGNTLKYQKSVFWIFFRGA